MSHLAILYPVLVQVALTFILLFWTGRARYVALQTRQVRPEDVALRQPNWPVGTAQVGNSFSNQFELPLLFYLLAVLAVMTRLTDVVLVALAWAFVLARCAHVYVHTTSNELRARGSVYGVGALILLAMWIWFLLQLLAAEAV
jgi:hypothetical protein